jgi:hypothetical protein
MAGDPGEQPRVMAAAWCRRCRIDWRTMPRYDASCPAAGVYSHEPQED